MSKVVTQKELGEHATPGNAWVVIDGDVYDVSKFAMMHPGGEEVLNDYAGKDCTDVFYGLHRHAVLLKYQPKLMVGRLETAEPRTEENRIRGPGELSGVPYCEPPAWQGAYSPYMTEEHIQLRKNVRKWLEENIREEAEAGEISGKNPSPELFKKMGESGLLAGRIGPGEHLKLINRKDIFGFPIEKFDYFAEGIIHEEVGRLACPGFVDGLGSGMCIGLPPVLQFGPDWMKEKVGREVLMGEKRICLAITEPFAGSDVAGIKTTAKKTPDGRHYIVSGVKKWITGGAPSHYFTTLCRTENGLSMILIERGEGVETKKIKTSYSPSAGTAYITFEQVKVPVENLIGFEDAGFLHAMYNFNHERWMIIAYIIAGARGMVEECFKWANQRVAFGKPLIQQPVIRQKLAAMVAKVESVYSWYESLTYQMTILPYDQQSLKLAGTMSLLKYQATRSSYEIADHAIQIFGGRGITKDHGMGMYVERFMKTNKFAAILGGSEEIMADLGIKQAVKKIPATAKL
mmetsp:Transcript_11000/g.19438  ORF Transcript_11000/g.19438 Transcript_11000/m.19438 type:complete len:517 (+) Transcript_11000:53-1603(+)|eukprot:CAMPEP_0184555106 /NCGR_PEP_ID=MMETSP0199_2-20130426/36714_1 /TAXON_ID=1112570 /ORGANISM="Thraustochytrium sp., Strain LLF1b" /LENGTH=516 /DNA_ID=CAMNT_0026951347 /DNA_START=42 /DNA_END=1592 /DNA_ORIENTATION=+